jgi:hypothetical protein
LKFKVPKFGKSDPRYTWVITQPEPMISFALCGATQSSPSIAIYTPEDVHKMLASNAREFLAKEVELSGFNSYESKANIIVNFQSFNWISYILF